MRIETRLDRLEAKLKLRASNKEWLFIMYYVKEETEAEAIARYEREHGIKIDEDKHNLIIYQLVKDKDDIELLTGDRITFYKPTGAGRI